uniref:Uncharacterized protein n=1 Tax=Octopus bimaculoides TaxID=37653 RepID=A0A0L8G4E3_OCTBM
MTAYHFQDIPMCLAIALEDSKTVNHDKQVFCTLPITVVGFVLVNPLAVKREL